MEDLLKLVSADNVLGAVALLGLFDLRRVLARIEARQKNIERRVNALEGKKA